MVHHELFPCQHELSGFTHVRPQLHFQLRLYAGQVSLFLIEWPSVESCRESWVHHEQLEKKKFGCWYVCLAEWLG